jgi:hypothetical protein
MSGPCTLARTIVYIDGFNLYYRALRGTPHKWLDIAAMSAAALPRHCQVERINYYTAHISGRVDPDAPRRQHAYLRAIATLPKVVIHYGNFLVSQKWAGLVQPPDFRPPVVLPAGSAPQVAYVWKTEEKGSDVNLGVHLVRDAFRREFDIAAVLTNVCRETLALTKMDWNNDGPYDRLPVTLNFAGMLATVIKRMPKLEPRSYPVRLFM